MRGALIVFALVGCGASSSAELFIDLRTDFVPRAEFASVRVEVFEALEDNALGREVHAEERAVDDSDYYGGVRILELDGLQQGDYAVVLRLLDSFREDLVPPRRVAVRVSERTAVTVLIMRDCMDIECPPTQTCIAGRCEDPGCIRGDEAVCLPDECTDASTCPLPVECGTTECVGGWCFYRFSDAACSRGTCDPVLGCADSDAGLDAATDVGLDAPLDAGVDAAACPAGFGDCNGDPADGCEADLRNSPSTCGDCDTACIYPSQFYGTRGTCVAGTCRVDCFTQWFADCNGDPADGCEADLSLPTNCGRCSNVCSGATPVCGVPPPAGPSQTRECMAACADPTPTNCFGACLSLDRGSFQVRYSPTYCNGCTGTPADACEAPLECCKGCCESSGTSGCVFCI